MPLSPKGLIESVILTIVITVALGADLGWFTNPVYANQMNQSAMNLNSSLNTGVWNPIFSSSYNATGGFNAQILSFTGLAFVISNIGTVMNSLLNVPRLFLVDMSISLSYLGIPNPVMTLMIPLTLTFLMLYITMMGVLTWMKAGYLWSGA
jgi:hypothetical protein